MRDHPFEGDGPYCKHWATHPVGDKGSGLWFSVECGWPRDKHPVKEEK